jgi:hypothetical protein
MKAMKLLVLGGFAVFAAEAVAAKKYIFSSWELGDLAPEEILAHADAFDRTAGENLDYGDMNKIPVKEMR